MVLYYSIVGPAGPFIIDVLFNYCPLYCPLKTKLLCKHMTYKGVELFDVVPSGLEPELF